MEQERLNAGIKERLDEWLDSYVLLGFDRDGNLIRIHEAGTDRDFLALEKAYMDWYDETYNTPQIEAQATWEDEED